MNEITVTTSTSTSSHLARSDSANTASKVAIRGDGASLEQSDDADEAVKNAVFGYIRAVRALGKTKVNTLEIAEALGLPAKKVEAALRALGDRGVKPLK